MYGADWIEKVRESYRTEGKVGIRAQKVVVEALLQKLASLPIDLFPSSNYTFVDSAMENVCRG